MTASSYPQAIDDLRTDYAGSERADDVDHAGMHSEVNAAVIAVQSELGVNPSGASQTVGQRLTTLEAGLGTAAGLDAPAGGNATAGQVVKGDDTRLGNARTPTAHKTSHATGGSDPLTPADIGAATSAQGIKADGAVQPTRAVSTGAGLTGGGSLAADRTISVTPGGIGTTQLGDDAVTAEKIAPGAVGDEHIAPGIDVAKISPLPANFGVIQGKGDLLAGVAAGQVARVAAGGDGQTLIGDITLPEGARWETPGNFLTGPQSRGETIDGFAGGSTHTLSVVAALTGGAAIATVKTVAGYAHQVCWGTNAWTGITTCRALRPCTPGDVLTFTADMWDEDGSCADRGYRAELLFRPDDAAHVTATAATVVAGASTVPSQTPQRITVTAVVPPGMYFFYARVASVSQVNTADNRRLLVSRIGVWRGAGGLWQPPGRPVPHLGAWIVETPTAGRACYVWDQVNARPQMVYYDSGWRDISALLVNGWTGTAYLRRADNMVMLRFDAVSGAAATADTVLTVPTGFRSESTIQTLLPANVSDATAVRARMAATGAVTILPRATATAVAATWPMSTTNALPAALPGTAQGAIPNV